MKIKFLAYILGPKDFFIFLYPGELVCREGSGGGGADFRKDFCICIVPDQVIQIETSHGSCPIRFEQPTKFPWPSGCASCGRLVL